MKEENQDGPVAQGLPGAARLEICTGCGHDKRIPIGPEYLACCPDSRYRTVAEVLRLAVEDGPRGSKVAVETVLDFLGTLSVLEPSEPAGLPEAVRPEGSPPQSSPPPLPPEGSTPLPLDLEALIPYLRHGKGAGPICESSKHSDYPCTCGLEALLRRLRDQGAA
jgi:hypothetical protein